MVIQGGMVSTAVAMTMLIRTFTWSSAKGAADHATPDWDHATPDCDQADGASSL